MKLTVITIHNVNIQSSTQFYSDYLGTQWVPLQNLLLTELLRVIGPDHSLVATNFVISKCLSK